MKKETKFYIRQLLFLLFLFIYSAIMIPMLLANTIIGVAMFIGWFVIGTYDAEKGGLAI